MRSILLFSAMLAFTTTNILTGTWTGEIKDADGGASAGAYLKLQQDGNSITGVTGADPDHSWPIKDAIYTGNRLTFTTISTDPESGAQSKWIFELKVEGDRMEGTGEGSREGHSWKMDLKLTRQK
jgi:hypothetical protein